MLDALGCPASSYSLASLRYDLSKLRAKKLVEKVPHSRRYCLLPCGYSASLVFLKLVERIYAPLTLYQRVTDDLDKLMHAVGLKTAA